MKKLFIVKEMNHRECVSFVRVCAMSLSSVTRTRAYRELLINKDFESVLFIEEV